MSALRSQACADTSIGTHSELQLLRRFGEYVARLGVQPVTVTISSLVEDMLDSYHQITAGLSEFSWSYYDLAALIEEFVVCQDVWHHAPSRQPTLEATFAVLSYGPEQLDVEIAFTPSLPTVQFQNLRNTIPEGGVFVLQPTMPIRATRASRPTESEYVIGPGGGCGWLGWDDSTASFRGAVPAKMASLIGAERVDAYTIPLELTARLTRHFGNMRFERIFRCVLPLTVKRRATQCSDRSCASPFRSPEICSARPSLIRPPLMRSPVRLGKENHSLSTEEVHKLLERKAETGRTASPLRLNSLSLARLHDAVALAHPPASVTDVEVRTVQCDRRDSIYSDEENLQDLMMEPTKDAIVELKPRTPRSERIRRCDSKMSGPVVDEAYRKTSTPPSVCYKCAVLGRDQSKGPHGECIGCAGTSFLRLDDALKEGWLRKVPSCLTTWNIDANAEVAVTAQPGPSRGRAAPMQAPFTQNPNRFFVVTVPDDRKSDSPPDAVAAASHPTEAEPSQGDIDRWQASIVRNYEEFERDATAILHSAIEGDAKVEDDGDKDDVRESGEEDA